MHRHAMRGLIVQTLYQIDVGAIKLEDAISTIRGFVVNLKDEVVDNPDFMLTNDVLEEAFMIEGFYFTNLEGIINNLEKIDQLLIRHLEGWSINRLNKVDKAILRLAVYEMMMGLAPINVVINEAIELTKDFTDIGDKKSPNFNNKLLDKIGKTLTHGGAQ